MMLSLAMKSLRSVHLRPAYSLIGADRMFSSEAEKVISIDRSGLFNPDSPEKTDIRQINKEPETEMARHIKSLIRFRGGPITLAEYMSEVLTNPVAGYYTQRDVFGVKGDFTTSPEISQMFGEMIGIWCVAMWQQIGQPTSLRLVELGPGRGTLMSDLLRGTAPFKDFTSALSISMVEVSPVLRKIQWETLGCHGDALATEENEIDMTEARKGGETATIDDTHENIPVFSGIIQQSGIHVSWHRTLDDIDTHSTNTSTDNSTTPSSTSSPPLPNTTTSSSPIPTLYIAHEFFDALPVHQFQRVGGTWRERLVGIAPPKSPSHLRLVLSPGETPASRTVLQRRLEGLSLQERAAINAIEICPQGMALVETLAQRVAREKGAALIMDYGDEGPYEGSLAAIRRHRFVHLFDQPGKADLSAWVDFGALRLSAERAVSNNNNNSNNNSNNGGGMNSNSSGDLSAIMHGPITQAQLLKGLGIDYRLERLLEQVEGEQVDALIMGYRRLIEGSKKSSSSSGDGEDMMSSENTTTNKGGGSDGKRRGGQKHGLKTGGSEETRTDTLMDGMDRIDGMGESYKAVCITPKDAPKPVVF